jgi:hypothetical protein
MRTCSARGAANTVRLDWAVLQSTRREPARIRKQGSTLQPASGSCTHACGCRGAGARTMLSVSTSVYRRSALRCLAAAIAAVMTSRPRPRRRHSRSTTTFSTYAPSSSSCTTRICEQPAPRMSVRMSGRTLCSDTTVRCCVRMLRVRATCGGMACSALDAQHAALRDDQVRCVSRQSMTADCQRGVGTACAIKAAQVQTARG